MIKFANNVDLIAHCTLMRDIMDMKWDNYNILINTPNHKLEMLYDILGIENNPICKDQLLNETPAFKLNEAHNMLEIHDRQMTQIYKGFRDMLKPTDSMEVKAMAKGFARSPILEELHGKRSRIIAEIIQHHRNGVTTDESFDVKGNIKTVWCKFGGTYVGHKNNVTRACAELAWRGY